MLGPLGLARWHAARSPMVPCSSWLPLTTALLMSPILGNIRCTPDDYTEHMASLNLSNGSSSANGSSDTRNLTEADCQSHSLGNLTHEQVVWRRYVTSTYISPLFDCPAAGSLVLSEPKSYAFQPNTMVRGAASPLPTFSSRNFLAASVDVPTCPTRPSLITLCLPNFFRPRHCLTSPPFCFNSLTLVPCL